MFTTLAFLLHRLAVFCMMFLKEAKLSDFDEVGSLMLLGAILTTISAIAVLVVYARVEDNEHPQTLVISIKPPQR